MDYLHWWTTALVTLAVAFAIGVLTVIWGDAETGIKIVLSSWVFLIPLFILAY